MALMRMSTPRFLAYLIAGTIFSAAICLDVTLLGVVLTGGNS